MTYAAKYTISALSGPYAEKYAVVCKDAQNLDALMHQFAVGRGLENLADRNAHGQHFDGYASFMQLMKVLKFVAKDKATLPFYVGVARQSGAQKDWAQSYVDRDEGGEFEVSALGKEAKITRNQESMSWDGSCVAGEMGEYTAITKTLKEIFFDDLRNLLNLCEEAMAKNSSIVLHVVDNDIAVPPALFQL